MEELYYNALCILSEYVRSEDFEDQERINANDPEINPTVKAEWTD